MKYLLLLILVVTSGCAPDNDRNIRCAPFIKAPGLNGFVDLETRLEVDVSQCDEIVVQ